METKRCAIYTRKSVEDGLEQEFNSLDAQREAGENYIASQKSNGWVCLPERYDDGGWSGGNIERPALKRLLDDVRAKKVDIIVVYKIDRLSRSLLDFSELQTVFDAHKVSFVAVTQEINTSTSAGRMMLNILMTFAQYEREIIAERIRDKVAASKKRGMHTGGVPPLGYKSDPESKKLQIIPIEAEAVRTIYESYLKHKSLMQTAEECNALGLRTKSWTSAKKVKHGGMLWTTGSIYRILANPLYAGMVRHYEARYPGEHDAIIERETYDAVQSLMKSNGNGVETRQSHRNPLGGLVRCGHCDGALTPTYTTKGGKRYGYYFCQKSSKNPGHQCPLGRIPAGELELAIMNQLAGLFQTPAVLKATLVALREMEAVRRDELDNRVAELESRCDGLKKQLLDGGAEYDDYKSATAELELVKLELAVHRSISEDELIAALGDAQGLWEELLLPARIELLHLIVKSVTVYDGKMRLALNLGGMKQLAGELAATGYFSVKRKGKTVAVPSEWCISANGDCAVMEMPLSIKKVNGHAQVIVPKPGEAPPKQIAVIRAIALAREWEVQLDSGLYGSVLELAKVNDQSPTYVGRILSLTGLAPDIVQSILNGTEPAGLSLAKLVKGFPLDWQKQREVLGF